MKLYSENENYKLYEGSMLDMLEVIEPNSIDSIVTDPPYGLTSITKRFGKENSAECQYGKDGSFQRLSKGFMGKEWDGSGIEYNIDTWKKCYEVLKPAGYLLAFGGSRTFHRIACAIEDAGFEIRDTIMWLYGSGFPKSMNINLALDKKNSVESKIVGGEYKIKETQSEWDGWGTALKPSFEPIIVARKPFKGSLVDNVIKNGVGGINIDECRVAFNGDKWNTQKSGKSSRAYQSEETTTAGGICEANDNGRFPANTILTYDETPSDERLRYFYCAKASKKDRDEGLDIEESVITDGRTKSIDNAFNRGETLRKNIHPTVKPTDLMQYLVRLVTPNNGIVLDPFNGSGSTGKAVMYENKERNKNYKYIGIELTEEYLPIAKARIEYVCNLIEEEKTRDKQLDIFDIGENI